MNSFNINGLSRYSDPGMADALHLPSFKQQDVSNMTKLNARLVSASLAALLMAAGASQVSAQEASPAPAAQPAPALQASDISDKKLEKFADSLGEVMEIREDFTAKLEKTGDQAEAQQLQQEANEKMMNTVVENDLSIEEYNAINQAVQNDPKLRDRVSAMVQN
jgi:transcription initiation factor IIF auxiliary subunit